MRARNIRLIALSLLIGLLASCSSQRKDVAKESAPASEQAAEPALAPQQPVRPSRIIVLIGDGMGVGQITAATYASRRPLAMLGMPEIGLMTTHSHEFVTTDSAASATAIASGSKTHFEGVGIKPGTTAANEEDPAQQLETVIDAAQAAQWKTGLVSTVRIVHATPAAFGAHRAHRHSYEAIAADLAASGVDVLMGAGSAFFDQRSDARDLLAEMSSQGYTVARTPKEVRAASQMAPRLVGLMYPKDMPPVTEPRSMSLAEMTRRSIEVLDRDNPNGFFLMVEGGRIDWAAHDLDARGAVAETLDFDAAVREALSYARGRQDTLVVATADHETGQMAVLDPKYAELYGQPLGGAAAMARKAAFPQPAPGAEATLPPVQHIAMPAAGAPADDPLELGGLGHEGLSAVFGHVTTASRGSCSQRRDWTGLHSATMVPIFSQGLGADYVAAADDNAELGRRLRALIDGEGAGAGLASATGSGGDDRHSPRNLVIMVGDGLGVGAMTAAHYGRGRLTMQTLPERGLVSTHAVDQLVNDSAASATALATGRRTRSGVVGMVPDAEGGLVAQESLLERAERGGKWTGIVTTTQLTHATPAAFYAHHASRKDEGVIADAFVDMPARVEGSDGLEVAIGGGTAIFGPERLERLRGRGVDVQTRWTPTVASDRQIVRLLADEGLPVARARHGDDDPATPTLAEMTRLALERLEAAPDGFVLIVEGGQIDWLQHGMDQGDALLDEVVDFDQAVAQAHRFARRDGQTLVMVTGDHDHTTHVIDNHYGFDDCSCSAAKACGGTVDVGFMPVALDALDYPGFRDLDLQGRFGPPRFGIQYAWLAREAAAAADRLPGPHSANFVPLFAYGPGASRLSGFRDQPQLGQILLDMVE